MKKQIPTFREYLGKMPYFENNSEGRKAFGNYIWDREKEYNKIYDSRIINRGTIEPERIRILHELDKKHHHLVSKEQEEQYDEAFRTIGILLAEGGLHEDHIHGKILDFGCGSGGSSIFLGLQSQDVTAVDKNGQRIQELKETGLFPADKTIAGNGIKYMMQEPPIYNLISAFGLGAVDTPVDFIMEFYKASKGALKPDGRIVVTSDLLTIEKAREIFKVPFRESCFEIICSR